MANRQEFYREKYRAKNPAWRDCLKAYIGMVDGLVGPETRVLDIGCGRADWLRDVYARTPHVHGLDPDAAALESNVVVKHKRVSTVDASCF